MSVNPSPAKIGKYTIDRELGRGSMGIVYHAIDPFTNREVAIKVAHPHLVNANEDADRFKRLFFKEARAAGVLNHSGIVKVFDADVDNDYCYIVTEYVAQATTLETYCRANSLLPLHEAVNIIYQSAKALDYAHRQGIIHRDVKPSNILLNKFKQIKLADFSIAVMTKDGGMHSTQLTGFVGSPLYMSPEQINEDNIAPNTDIFSLGIITYQLITGHHPFRARNLSAICRKITKDKQRPISAFRDDIPNRLDYVVERMLDKNPKTRYRMAIDLAADLTVLFEGLDKIDSEDPARKKLESIMHLAFFQEFDQADLWSLVRVCPFEKYAAGDTVIKEGERDKSVYFLISGIARVEKKGQQLGIIQEGECFGEIGYFADVERTATVTAKTDIQVMRFNLESIQTVSVETQMRFNKAFLTTVIARLADTSVKLVNLKEMLETNITI